MSTVTETTVVNDALIELSQDTLASLDQGTSVSRACKEIYESSRDRVLEEHPWKFATKRVTLSPSSTTPDHKYNYAYDLPADFIALVSVESEYKPYEIENNMIVTDASSGIAIKYVYRNSVMATWSPAAREALSTKIAAKLAPKLTSNREGVKDRMENLYALRLRAAKNLDAQSSGQPTPNRPTTLINSRS